MQVQTVHRNTGEFHAVQSPREGQSMPGLV